MTKKLLKYDFKNMTKILVYIYAITFGLACATRIINLGKQIQLVAIIGSIFSGLTYSAIASIIINMFIHIITNFNHTFYKDESYLTHTLPVKKEKLLLSKYLASLLVVLSSVAVCFVSLFVMLYSKSFISKFKLFLKATLASFSLPAGVLIALFIGIICAEICSMISMSFLSIIKANQSNKKGLSKGIIWFLGLYFASEILTLILSIFISLITGNIKSLFASTLTQSNLMMLLITTLVSNIVFLFVFYFLAKKEFKKGVNID